MNTTSRFTVCALLAIQAPGTALAAVRSTFETVALLDEQAPVSNGDQVFFESFQLPVINNLGEVAFCGSIENSSGNLSEDQGIWVSTNGVLTERVREGQSAPGAASDGSSLFSDFRYLSLTDEGSVGYLGGTHDSNYRDGYWLSSAADTIPVAVSNTSMPGSSKNYSTLFFYQPAFNSQGQIAVNLSIREPGTSPEEGGIFTINSQSADVIALENEAATGTSGNFDNLSRIDPPINSAGATAFGSGLKNLNTGQSTSRAIYAGNAQSIQLLALQGDPAPGTDGYYSQLSGGSLLPINISGDTVFTSELDGGSTTSDTDTGIWRSRGSAVELLAREGDVAIPAVGQSPSYKFDRFVSSQLIDDIDQVVFMARLRTTDSSSTHISLWSAQNDELKLLLMQGMTAPGTGGETFGGFPWFDYSTNRFGQLVSGARIGSSVGIWAQDPSGELRLIGREGDTVEISPNDFRQITDLGIDLSSGGSDGRPRSINDSGEIVFVATFDDGSEGIFVSDAASYYASDFDRDGDVDGDDLTKWRDDHGANGNSDADGDGTTSGLDYLTWQRQKGLGTQVPATIVPEPVTHCLLGVGLVQILGQRRRVRVPYRHVT